MPRFDELPITAQNELRAKRGEGTGIEHPEKRRMGLLQRLASVGLGGGRREESDDSDRQSQAARPMPRVGTPAPRAPAPSPQRPVGRAPESRGPEPVSEYAKRPQHQGLDPLGRQAPVHNPTEEDHLDIPAFLRRQVN
jgi:cell division protein FtsZ